MLIYLLPPTLLDVNANDVGWSSLLTEGSVFLFAASYLCSADTIDPASCYVWQRHSFLYFFASGAQKHQRVVKLEYERTNEWLSYRVSSCRTFREAKEIKKKPAEIFLQGTTKTLLIIPVVLLGVFYHWGSCAFLRVQEINKITQVWS